MKTLLLKKERHIAHVKLNRPDVHNAFNEALMQELKTLFEGLATDREVRIVVLEAEGKSFCAGGDLNYMKSAAQKNSDQNREESLLMAKMFSAINDLPKTVVGVIHGAVFGGGVGLTSVCDIVLAEEKTVFSLSEVRLGLAPSVISPFVIEKIGLSQARRYFLTGERFDARAAREIGLVHAIFTETERQKAIEEYTGTLLNCSPSATAAIKDLIRHNITLEREELRLYTAEHISALRASAEAQEGMSAFFEKRKPKWVES